jgi:hypothetical protein
MNSSGKYIINRLGQLRSPLKKVAVEPNIYRYILSKILRSERISIKEMLGIFAKTFEIQEREIQIEVIQTIVFRELGYLEFLPSLKL